MAYDVIILAGQSNAEGHGLGPTDFPYETDDRILMMRDTQWYGHKKQPDGTDKLFFPEPYKYVTEIAKERFDGQNNRGIFALSFAKRYVNEGYLSEGRKLLIINAAVGGTGFTKKEWGVGNILHERMFAMIKDANLGNDDRFVALLWHQGEHDSVANGALSPSERYDFYYSSIKPVIEDVRSRCGEDELPFIAGEFVSEWKDIHAVGCDAVISATRDVCDEVGHARMVKASDLKSNNQSIGNGDNIHFCRDALNTLGNRYFDAYKDILGEN